MNTRSAGAGIEVQRVHLEVFEQDAAMRVDDAFRQPGRVGAVEDPQWVVEGDLFVGRFGLSCYKVAKRQGPHGQGPVGIEVADDDEVPHGGELASQFGHAGEPVEVLAPEAVAVDGDQHGRLDLPETVGRALGAEVRGAARPDSADAGGGE